MTDGRFSPDLFQFLRELAQNNTRDWFQENRIRYRRDVQEPLLGFISAFSAPLSEIAPHYIADPRPSGGSMFRIHRDVRFSRDKSPYKTHAAAQFRHRRGKDVHAPGFYLHLAPGEVFGGAGIWHPDGATLRLIRQAIVEDPHGWIDATQRLKMGGDKLKRPPRGFDPDHPLIEEIKRKDFITMTTFSEEAVLGEDFVESFAAECRRAVPMMRFLTGAVGLEF